ncbi:glycoside hydrolase family 43 protein [Butyrivibrio sp. YAB3001]|uniref:glycoside hydrolase family 43 protein n=1 Tax=Butyrivibrio sp. YAB3001 TaxID=1520812 RepID=UPI0008F65AAD|nr:glycoside hydrolase 43 family protein [Butyrivibrio sp. YAB3001]SFB87924.1 Glycosyl hydrolases family 43 [Butyrivibrio sp. YAB3001]
MNKNNVNPIIKLDYPDPDIIRVDDTYYMVSTTMYFMPGCEILRSYDLCHWEHVSYVYDTLDSTNAQCLIEKENAYGQGMWAASLRYHDGLFYICFVANDTHKTYLFTSKKITGPWEKSEIPGFYHDNSILFDDDGRVFIVSGNREIHLRELCFNDRYKPGNIGDNGFNKDSLLLPKEGGLDTIILKDSDDAPLGFEGSHLYKINGKYYLFVISIPKEIGKRTESCFVADKPEGPYIGKEVMFDDGDYRNSGVAQGGIVETHSGKWYSILFQDSGSVGRIPVLMPVHFEQVSADSLHSGIISEGKNAPAKAENDALNMIDFPVFGDNGRIPTEFALEDLRPGYQYAPLVSSDYFTENVFVKSNIISDREILSGNTGEDLLSISNGCFGFKSCWQFNHDPELSLIQRDLKAGTVTITTDKLCDNLVQARNVLTQRTLFPGCRCSVNVDASNLNEGDYAGLCMLESNYAFIGVTKRDGEFYLVMSNRKITTGGFWGERNDTESATEVESIKLSSPIVTLYCAASFDKKSLDAGKKIKDNLCREAFPDPEPSVSFPDLDDTARFYYKQGKDDPKMLGTDSPLRFMLDHFTGARFGLFIFSTRNIGGSATFSKFNYITD